MDVRCEKCQTEYELDESKLKPGGVTVKCTTCGHMFKVRGRTVGQDEAPASRQPSRITPVPDPHTRPTSPSMVAERASSVLMDAEEGERTWLIRLEDGEIKTCRELSTLQKWIVSGRVSRGCSISRTGKKWKLLGEIGELASFFGIADEAHEARASGRWSTGVPDHASDLPSEESFVGAAPMRLDDASGSSNGGSVAELADPGSGPNAGSFVRTLPLGGAALAPGPRSGAHDAHLMAAQAEPSASDLPIEPDDSNNHDSEVDQPRVRQPSTLGTAPTLPPYGAGMLDDGGSGSTSRPSAPIGFPLQPPPSRPSTSSAPAGPVTGGWATKGQVRKQGSTSRDGASGPTGGRARGQSDEAAFVGGGGMPNIRGEFENGRFVPTSYSDDEPLIPPRSRGGLWVILFSLIVMAGAAGTVYLFLYTGGEESEEAAPVAQPADAAVAVAPQPPVTPPTTPAPPDAAAELDKLLTDADTALVTDSQETLEPTAEQLSALASGAGGEAAAKSPAFLAMRSRVETALGQQLLDRAKLAPTPAESKKLTEQARARGRTAHQLADQALALQADHPAAVLAMADARRLEGDRTIEVERLLRRVAQFPQGGAALARDADMVMSLLRVRDDRLRDARVLLDKLAKASPAGDVRARFRLAWIDYLDANADAAVSGAEAVLKAQPRHTGARALLDKIAGTAKPPVDTADPMPPEEPASAGKPREPVAGKPAEGGNKPAEGGKPAAGSRDSFDAVLARAEKLAEDGNCGGAMPLYRKVLDMHPASVEALTGLGYCHLDRREFASAHARFRAALGISSRYQPAMWGIAEAYQRQGLKPQALERFEAFLSEHPTSPRASAARLRIDNLKREIGDSSGSGSGGTGSGTGSGTPPTPPDSTQPPPSSTGSEAGKDGPIEPPGTGSESGSTSEPGGESGGGSSSEPGSSSGQPGSGGASSSSDSTAEPPGTP